MTALNIVFSFPSCIIKNVSAIDSSSIIIHDNHDIPFFLSFFFLRRLHRLYLVKTRADHLFA
jgi:hypothetical protein